MNEKELRDADCFFATDRVPGDPLTTEWKRRARLHQARWREDRGYPPGSQPYSGGRLVGSRLKLEFARNTGANFLNPSILAAVKHRIANPERHQMLSTDRLWADLLSSMPLCFNLFAGFTYEPKMREKAARAWWPDAPAGDVTVRFEHSPGRVNHEFLGNKTAFDVAFEFARPDGHVGIVGVETKYHEHAKPESPPSPDQMTRYIEVTERSNAFTERWCEKIVGTPLQQVWLDHLLLLSMLQHPSGRWNWGRFVLVYPSANPTFASLAQQYRAVLRNPETYEARTIESLISDVESLEPNLAAAFQERYLL